MSEQVKSPVISVILPTWNCADLLREAVASVIAQTFTDWEVIVINNFSNDHTKDVIASFKDHRICLIDYDNKGVIAAARNQGIAVAKGRWIAFLDSDDFWLPTKLERALSIAATGEADLVCHGERHFRVNKSGEKDGWNVFYGASQPHTYQSLLYRGNFLSTSAVVVKADLLRRVKAFSADRCIVTAEDYDLWLKLLAAGAKVKIVREILGGYRIHDTSASASIARHLRAVRQVVINHHHAASSRKSLLDRWSFLLRMGRLTLSSCRVLARRGHLTETLAFAAESLKGSYSSIP